jgi:hypothetical protein
MTKTGCLVLALTLCACREQRPPAPTPQQANQLNEAEELLNQAATNEKGPADRSTGPSNSSD